MLQARPAVAAHNSDPKDRSLEEHQLRQIIDLIPQHIVIIEPGGSSAKMPAAFCWPRVPSTDDYWAGYNLLTGDG